MFYEWITSKDDCDHEDGENKTHHLDDVHSFFNSDDEDADVADTDDTTAARSLTHLLLWRLTKPHRSKRHNVGLCAYNRTLNDDALSQPVHTRFRGSQSVRRDQQPLSHKQEAPLTLRGQRGRCRNIKEPKNQIYGSFPNSRPHLLFLWV